MERFQAVHKAVPVLRGEMYDCLSSRVKRRSNQQRLIIFEVPKCEVSKCDDKEDYEKIPDNTKLRQNNKAFELFGIYLANDTITWREFEKLILSHSDNTGGLAVSAIKRAFSSAVSTKINRDNEQIIRGFRDNRIYRLIVTEHFDYYDGRKVLHMYLIEKLEVFTGEYNRASIILGFINLAAKYRFLFIESASELSLRSFKIEKKPPKEIQEKVRRLVRELCLIEEESELFKIGTTAAIDVFGQGLSDEDIIELNNQWFDVRPRLEHAADALLRANPESDEFAKRSTEWLLVLEEFSKVSRKVNSTAALRALENIKKVFLQ
jgi:hypothetical protein